MLKAKNITLTILNVKMELGGGIWPLRERELPITLRGLQKSHSTLAKQALFLSVVQEKYCFGIKRGYKQFHVFLRMKSRTKPMLA